MALEILTDTDIWRVLMPNHPLIEGVLWEGDVVMLLGSEKAGKSILGLQMAFCLSTGAPFLDKYVIPHPTPVMYIQTEGKENELVERMRHMANTLDIDETRFSRVFQHFLALDDLGTVTKLIQGMERMALPPKVLVLDSLYTSMVGDLNDNHAVRRFITAASEFLKRPGTTLVIIHHETKEQWEDGRVLDKGDRSSYGSVFLRAWVSHILYLKKHKDKSRILSCDTQRSGKVLEREELTLIEPNPLCFQLKGDQTPSAELTYKHLEASAQVPMSQGLTREQLKDRTGLSMAAVEKGLRQLLVAKRVTRTVAYPRTYRIRTSKDGEFRGLELDKSPSSP